MDDLLVDGKMLDASDSGKTLVIFRDEVRLPLILALTQTLTPAPSPTLAPTLTLTLTLPLTPNPGHRRARGRE